LSVTFKRVSLGSQPAYNGVFESSSGVSRLIAKQVLNMRVMHD
jgi:hypothetical protein